MKKSLIFFAFVGMFANSFAQTKEKPLVINYNANWQPVTSGKPYFYAKAWPENGKWHRQDFYAEDNKMQMDGWFADADFKIKDGPFTYFSSTGKLSRKEFYSSNKLEGDLEEFYLSGKKATAFKYHQGILIDSGYQWHENGEFSTRLFAGSNGSGSGETYYDDGKLRTQGKIVEGDKSGNWMAYTKDGKKAMEVTYDKDSIIKTTCVDANGLPTTGECVFEKAADFRGGIKGWTSFLEQNLTYPKYAQKKQIEGIVKVQFIVSKTGDISDIKIISSPHESLSEEVLRLMKNSPRWRPALIMNEPVIYRHIQTISFRLE